MSDNDKARIAHLEQRCQDAAEAISIMMITHTYNVPIMTLVDRLREDGRNAPRRTLEGLEALREKKSAWEDFKGWFKGA